MLKAFKGKGAWARRAQALEGEIAELHTAMQALAEKSRAFTSSTLYLVRQLRKNDTSAFLNWRERGEHRHFNLTASIDKVSAMVAPLQDWIFQLDALARDLNLQEQIARAELLKITHHLTRLEVRDREGKACEQLDMSRGVPVFGVSDTNPATTKSVDRVNTFGNYDETIDAGTYITVPGDRGESVYTVNTFSIKVARISSASAKLHQ